MTKPDRATRAADAIDKLESPCSLRECSCFYPSLKDKADIIRAEYQGAEELARLVAEMASHDRQEHCLSECFPAIRNLARKFLEG